MRIHFLGTGAAEGIPAINCQCNHCVRARAEGGKLVRRRSAILFSLPGYELLVDTPPDIKTLLRLNGVQAIDGIFLTHEHYDHVSGLAEFAYWERKVDLLMEGNLYDRLQQQGVTTRVQETAFHMACRPGVALRFDGFFLVPFAVRHTVPCFGLAIYAEDRKIIFAADTSAELTHYARRLTQGADLLIVNTPFFDQGGNDHLNVVGAIRWKETLDIKGMVLTHINHHNLPHDDLERYVSRFENVQVAYDGLTIEM